MTSIKFRILILTAILSYALHASAQQATVSVADVARAAAGSPNEIAVFIIQSEFSLLPNPPNLLPEEEALKVWKRLNTLMVKEPVSEEVRCCYAILVLNGKISQASLLKSSTAPIQLEVELRSMKAKLLKRLNELSPGLKAQ
jgi:hypothetical protein